MLDKYDVKCDYDNIFGVKGTRWLRSLKLSDNDQILLHEYVMQIEFLNTEIKNIESKIISEASKNESVKILMNMTGIDYFSAMMISSEIGDITRFGPPEKLVSWSGLCPSIHQSGNSLYMGRMKDGNKKDRHEPYNIFIMVFLSIGIVPLFFSDWVLQTRVLYNIPFQIPYIEEAVSY